MHAAEIIADDMANRTTGNMYRLIKVFRYPPPVQIFPRALNA
jgi:hypothetical protein